MLDLVKRLYIKRKREGGGNQFIKKIFYRIKLYDISKKFIHDLKKRKDK